MSFRSKLFVFKNVFRCGLLKNKMLRFFPFFDGQFTFISEPRHHGQPGFALGFWDDFGGSRGEQMAELKSRVFPREDGFFSNSRSTEIRVKIPVYISKG